MKIGICICTYRRPEGLSNLLTHLSNLDTEHNVFVAIADNDNEEQQGIEVAKSIASSYKWPMYWKVVGQTGISYSRNAVSLIALQQKPDLVAYLDDDEWPSNNWLQELVRVQLKYNADAVGGPTCAVFPSEATTEQQKNSYFGADLKLPDGSACQLEAAGNFIIKASVLSELMPEPFDPQFALSGGEDLAFFMRLKQAGYSMHWAANAKVSESVSTDRLSVKWMQRRVMLIANSRVHVMRKAEPGLRPALIRGCKTIALFAYAGLTSLMGLVIPDYANKARILRWKFWGKFTAHLRRNPQRIEGR